MTENSKEILILENIYQSSQEINQRNLARIAGLSLGMTNTILKRLVLKGLLTIKRVNNRNIHYIVTPSGIEMLTRKSYRYFRRTIKNVVYYKEAIEELVEGVKAEGYDGLLLQGPSDLDFIVEYACKKHGLAYVKADKTPENVFILYSESYIPDKETENGNNVFLQKLLI